ncbi:MAG: translation elongation factor Ts [Lentisphaerae bacterium]|nr:translation elongation factor Ts [Lentisphaerota bacterium]
MTEISAATVKQLRDSTNVSMMECKRALVEAGGDVEKATRLLRERGMAVAAKKASRTANQGLVASAASADGRTVSLVEVNCETDFVARNADFQKFVANVAARATETDAPLRDAMSDVVTAAVASIGENIVLKRNTRLSVQGVGMVGSYIHLGGKVGVLVEVACGKAETESKPGLAELAKDMTLQIAAASPKYVSPAEVDKALLAQERDIYAKQIQNKPPQVVEKIVDGKIKKFFSEICLVEQPYIREPKMTVQQVIDAKAKELGDTLSVRRFVRFQLGE